MSKIDICFFIDTNGILDSECLPKSCKVLNVKNKIMRVKGRLSREEIEMMVQKAEKFKEEDDIVREKLKAKKCLEDFIFLTKNKFNDESSEENFNRTFDDVIEWLESRKYLQINVDNVIKWLENQSNEEPKAYYEKQKELEDIFKFIMM